MSTQVRDSALVASEPLLVRVNQIVPSPTNPRKAFDKKGIEELAASIQKHGVLQAVLVRPWPASRKPPKELPEAAETGFELVVGERRWRAAKAAGLEKIPARVLDLDDQAAIEIQVVENLQRSDLHPLEEADGYRQLMAKGHDVARIAEQTGRSVGYIYDRVKLLSLTKAAQREFLEGRIAIGHAIILARLRPADQVRAMDVAGGGLWEDERTLFDPDDDDANDQAHYKARTARELQAWVDRHVKLEAADLDPMLFLESTEALAAAKEAKEKIVRVTHEQITPDEAKKGPRPILGRSWKRADGQRGSKTCEHSVLGSIVIGVGRGQVLQVCIDKKRCTVHWGDDIKARKKREREVQQAGGTGEDREALRRKKEDEDLARRAAEAKRWNQARPAMLEALAAAVKKSPAGAGSLLGQRVFDLVRDEVYLSDENKKNVTLVPVGKTAEDLVRHLAFMDLVLGSEQDAYGDRGRVFTADAKAIGVDVAKILDAATPGPARAPSAPASDKGKKPKRKR